MGLTTAQIDSITRQISGQFPEMQAARPVVQSQVSAKSGSPPTQYVLTFRGQGRGPDGQTITRLVRVVASESGKVLKISTSR